MDIDEAAECDVRLFWKLIKRQRPRSSRVCPEIGLGNMTFSDPGDITNALLNTLKTVTTQMTTTHSIPTTTTTLKTRINP